MFIDGKLVLSSTNANLNGLQSMAGAGIEVGGVITSFNMTGARCHPFSTCPGSVPGTGAPHPYHRYIDDIIVMKR